MKLSPNNTLIISILFFSLMIQVYPINAETVLEYQVEIGDVMNYSMVKLNQISKNEGELWIRKAIQLDRTIWDINTNKFSYSEQQGTRYTFEVIQVNNSVVCADFSVNNELVGQVYLTNYNYFQRFLIKTTSNETYFEQLSIKNDQYELNQGYLYETAEKRVSNTPISSSTVIIHNVWDIKTGWLMSCHYVSPDSSLTDETDPRFYGIYEYEIVNETLANSSMDVPWIALTIFVLLISIIFVTNKLLRK